MSKSNVLDLRTMIGEVKEWHDPRNDACLHNRDVCQNCTCKRPQKRKPYRVVRVTDRTVTGKTRSRLILEIWPHGRIVMREHGRRIKYETTAARLYEGARWRVAMLAAQAARAARRAGKKSSRRTR